MNTCIYVLILLFCAGVCLGNDDDDGGGFCVTGTDCNNNGDCIDSACDCDKEYAGEFCEDERKSLLVALLLFIFVGSWGAGDFYTGYIGIGIAKAVINGVTLFIPVIGWIFHLPWAVAVLIWNVVYIAQFATDERQDSDGYSLY